MYVYVFVCQHRYIIAWERLASYGDADAIMQYAKSTKHSPHFFYPNLAIEDFTLKLKWKLAPPEKNWLRASYQYLCM